ncbi:MULTISPECIES: hypothetical protein [unclassified Variovorax]|uniref:hypothetical protein n=1 Tax=unclassified Variovorax TaxID=663243 RepID=UPI003ED1538F
MSLLGDLQSIDLGAIVQARGSISVSVSTPQMQALMDAGAASSALGSLGGGIDGLRTAFPAPDALLKPLVAALEQLGGRFDVGDLPLADYAKAVGEGLSFVTHLAKSVSGEPANFGDIFGTPLAEAVRVAGGASGELGKLFGSGADSFVALSRMANQDIRDPSALVDLAAQVLLPFPQAQLGNIRTSIATVLDASGTLHLPADRHLGLVAAFDAVAVAAAGGNAATLDAALRNLQQVRGHTLGVLRDDLLFAMQQVQRLKVPQFMQPLVELNKTLKLGERGVIEFLDDFRDQIRAVRALMDNPDLGQVRTFIQGLAPMIEERARVVVEQPIDAAVVRAKDFVRRSLRSLPVRDLRQQITIFLHDAVEAVESAGLDGPARTAREALASVANQLDAGALTDQIQGALQEVDQVMHQALDGVIAALDTIAQRIDEVADQAVAILGKLAEGLAAFKATIDGIAQAIHGLGIEQVEEQLVSALSTLRESASELLANVPLPEPLRPQVEQLIELLEGVDFDAVFEPVRNAVAELRIPDDVAATVESGLAEAQRVVSNLIPASLIADIEAEVNSALDTIRNFNPASLLPDVSQYLDQAADLIESLDPRAIAETIRAPFQLVLDAIDKVHPNRLLAPVISGYDALLAQIPVPDAQASVRGLRASFDSVGRTASRAALEPARRMAGDSDATLADPDTRTTNSELPPATNTVHAGDAIRLLGFIPARLRTLLSQLEAGPAGEVMAALDGLCAGLARQLRGFEAALHAAARRLEDGVEAMFTPLAPAQMRAHLALQANLSTPGGEVRLHASLAAVGQAGPAALRRELADTLGLLRASAAQLTGGTGGALGPSVERTAQVLESCPLARFSGNLDDLLEALDPEPIALEVDALVDRMVSLTPQLVAELLPDLRTFVQRMQALINHYNPGAQARKFLQVLEVVREELDVLDPRRLAAELAELHAALRASVAAYDPRVFAEELAAITRAMAAQIRALDPAALLGDLTFLQDAVDRVASANPAERLAEVGTALAEVGTQLGAIDLNALIDSVSRVGPRLVESFEALIAAVRNEIVALLESLRFAMVSGSASVSADVSIG